MIDHAALVAYIERGVIPGGPITVHVDVANSCNLSCITCWNHSPYLNQKKDTAWVKEKMDLEKYLVLLDELGRMNTRKVIISGGGEPFTHKDIYKMIARTREQGLLVTVITNALLIDPTRLLQAPPHRVLANVCAAGPGVYNRVHPGTRPGDFEKLLHILEALNGTVPLTLVMVISAYNFHQLNEMVDLAAGFRKAALSFKLAGLSDATARFGLKEEEKRLLLDEVIPRAEKKCARTGVKNNLEIFRGQLQGEGSSYPIHETGCFAGLFYSRIDTDGSLYYCCSPITVGNVFDTPYSSLWKSEGYNRLRERLRGNDFFPACRRCGKFNLNFKAREWLTAEGY